MKPIRREGAIGEMVFYPGNKGTGYMGHGFDFMFGLATVLDQVLFESFQDLLLKIGFLSFSTTFRNNWLYSSK